MMSRRGERRATRRGGWLRAAAWGLAGALALLVGLGGGEAWAENNKPRFSHAQHAERTPDCTGCHRISEASGWQERQLVGTGRGGNEHRPCSNGGCHANQWGSRTASAFCWTCHTGTLRTVRYPPYAVRGESEFYLKPFSHKAHIREGNKGCEQCHTLAKKKPLKAPRGAKKDELLWDGRVDMVTVGHQVCGERICHGGEIKPHMSSCAGCHVQRGDQEVTPLATASTSSYRVKYAFDHAAHEKGSGDGACATCHINAAVGAGEVVPMPPMVSCEGCHNGSRAFSALGHACRRCHLVPEGGR